MVYIVQERDIVVPTNCDLCKTSNLCWHKLLCIIFLHYNRDVSIEDLCLDKVQICSDESHNIAGLGKKLRKLFMKEKEFDDDLETQRMKGVCGPRMTWASTNHSNLRYFLLNGMFCYFGSTNNHIHADVGAFVESIQESSDDTNESDCVDDESPDVTDNLPDQTCNEKESSQIVSSVISTSTPTTPVGCQKVINVEVGWDNAQWIITLFVLIQILVFLPERIWREKKHRGLLS